MMHQHSWAEPQPCDVNDDLLAACRGDAFLAEILVRRGFRNPQQIRAFLSVDAYSPCPPEQLPDLEIGSELIRQAIREHRRILVWGDFDVDGQTSTALLMDGLQRLDADVMFHIPIRTADSHGIKVHSLEQQVSEQHPDLLITCDTGITEYDALDYARSVNLPVIVTDHHDLGDHLPQAAAVINPRRLHDRHPLASLPGVGVAFKLLQHVYTTLGHERELSRLLDLVALGIIGDIAKQTDDTRYLLQLGLDRLRHTERIGLRALMEVANLPPDLLDAEQIGYQIGPRLNAVGRLDDARLGVELLVTHNSSRARILAQQLEGLNNERRVQTKRIEAMAEELIAANPAVLESEALVLYSPDWHPGIVGIIAGRLAERYRRPAVLFAGEEGGIARGSARTDTGHDLGKAIAAQADLLRSYGGHTSAVGLSLDVQNIGRFRERLSSTLAAMGNGTGEETTLRIDSVVPLDMLTLDLARRIQQIGPFGEGNPPVTLATTGLHLSRSAMIGRDQQHRRLVVEDDQGRQQFVLWWGGARAVQPDGIFDIAYTVAVNARQELQLSLVDFREREPEVIEVQAPPAHVEDWRSESDPLAKLETILTPDSIVWAEAYSRQQYPTWKRRAELIPAVELIIYTTPPDPKTLQEVLDRVQPQTVHVLAIQPPLPTMQAFLVQLTQAVRNVVEQRDGETALDILCGATAQSPGVVRAGLEFLRADKQIGSITWLRGGKVKIAQNGTPPEAGLVLSQTRARLEAAYLEVDAYRRYFRTAPADRLLMP